MADLHEYKESLSENLMQVIALLEEYGFDEGQSHSHDYSRLQRKLDTLHPADVADILEALPLDQRLQVWDLVKAERDGDILLEVSDAVRPVSYTHLDVYKRQGHCSCACFF